MTVVGVGLSLTRCSAVTTSWYDVAPQSLPDSAASTFCGLSLYSRRSLNFRALRWRLGNIFSISEKSVPKSAIACTWRRLVRSLLSAASFLLLGTPLV